MTSQRGALGRFHVLADDIRTQKGQVGDYGGVIGGIAGGLAVGGKGIVKIARGLRFVTLLNEFFCEFGIGPNGGGFGLLGGRLPLSGELRAAQEKGEQEHGELAEGAGRHWSVYSIVRKAD